MLPSTNNNITDVGRGTIDNNHVDTVMFGGMTGSCWDAIYRALPKDNCLPLTALQATNRYIARQDTDGSLLGLPPRCPIPALYDEDDGDASQVAYRTDDVAQPTPSMLVSLFDEAQAKGIRCCFPMRHTVATSSHNDRRQPMTSKSAISASCMVFRPIASWSKISVPATKMGRSQFSEGSKSTHQQLHEAVAITLRDEDVVSVPMMSKLVASLVPTRKNTSTNSPSEILSAPIQKHIVALTVNTCEATRKQSLLVLIKAAVTTPILSHLTVIDFRGVTSANGSVAWGAAKAAGQSLRRLRVIGNDSSTSSNLEEVRRLCTRLEDVELMITADFAMLSYAKLIESCGQTLRRVALFRGGRTVSSHALQNALAHHCTQLRDIETIEFIFAHGEGSGTVEKLFRNNPHLHSVRINYKKEWVPLLTVGILFPPPPRLVGVGAASSSSLLAGRLVASSRRHGEVGGGVGGGVDGLRSLSLYEPRADLQRTGSSDDDTSTTDSGEDESTTGRHDTPQPPPASSTTARRFISQQPRAITLLSPCFQSGNLTSLNLNIAHLYHILPFPELLLCSSSSLPPSSAHWNPFMNIVSFSLTVGDAYLDADEVDRWEKKRLRAHKRAWEKKYGLGNGSGGFTKHPPDWAVPPPTITTPSIGDTEHEDNRPEGGEEEARRKPPPPAARSELAALILAMAPSVRTLLLHNCAYAEVVELGIPNCLQLEKLSLIEMVTTGNNALTDERIGRLLTSIGASNTLSSSPLRSLKIGGYSALGDLTIKALTHANLPYLSTVLLFTSEAVGFMMSEEPLMRLISTRRFGLIKDFHISCEHNDRVDDTASFVEFTPAVANAWIEQVILEESAATTTTTSNGTVSRLNCGSAAAFKCIVNACGDISNAAWNDDMVEIVPSNNVAADFSNTGAGITASTSSATADSVPPYSSFDAHPTTRTGSSSRFANNAVESLSARTPLTVCNITITRVHGGRLSVVQNGEGQCRHRVMQPLIVPPAGENPLEPPTQQLPPFEDV